MAKISRAQWSRRSEALIEFVGERSGKAEIEVLAVAEANCHELVTSQVTRLGAALVC
jgi:hypothetical protein